MHGRRGGEADRLGDLAHGRRIAARADRRRDHVHDLALAFRVVTGHRAPPSLVDAAYRTAVRCQPRREPDGRARRCYHRHPRRACRGIGMRGAGWPRSRAGARDGRSTKRPLTAADRHPPAAGLAAFLPLASRAPHLRPAVLGARPRRPDARRPQGAARGRARLPRRRTRPRPGRPAAHRRARRPGRRGPRRGPVPRRRARRTCSTRSWTSWASTGARSATDVARIRRFTPGRSAAHHSPRRRELVQYAGDTLERQRGRTEGPGLDQQGGLRSREGHPDEGRRRSSARAAR